MKLALYLPNFRDKITVKELEDLTALAEDLDYDSVWTLDRICRPRGLRPGGAAVPVRHDERVPEGHAGRLPGRVVPGHDADPLAGGEDHQGPDRHEHHRHPYRSPGVLAAELATQDHLSNGRLNVGVGSGWMPEEFAAASATDLFPRRHAHLRETIEIMQGIWTNDLFEYHGEFADFDPSGFGHKPLQKPGPPIYFSGTRDPSRSAKRIAKYGLSGLDRHPGQPGGHQALEGRDGTRAERARQDAPRELRHVQHDLVRHHGRADGPDPAGKGTNLLAGSAQQIEDILKRYKEAGMTMPLLWPPFRDVPTSKTMDDLKRLKEEIMPKVEAM